MLSSNRSSKARAEFTAAASLFAALGDETRLKLARRLADQGPMSITNLAAGSKISRQAITKHLRVLERAGLVHREKRARESLCRVNPLRLQDAHYCLDLISRQWDEALGRLRQFVEG